MLYSNDLEFLKCIYPKVINFINSNDLNTLPVGRYSLGQDDYVNIEKYFTRARDDAQYESHERYCDIQYVISGSEDIEVAKKDFLKIEKSYDNERDICFYSSRFDGYRFQMDSGDYLVLMPEDAHMPCLSREKPNNVKKAIFKIALSPECCFAPRLLIIDVDGTMTDGGILIGPNGELAKKFNVKDGFGIHDLLPKMGITPAVITGRTSGMLESRCHELGIMELHQGISDKTATLHSIVEKYGIGLHEVAYIGDDLNDLECMQEIKKHGGFIGCPADAVSEIAVIADYITSCRGGEGAVRDFIDWLASLQDE